MRAGRPENKEEEYFTFILIRDDANRFEIDVQFVNYRLRYLSYV